MVDSIQEALSEIDTDATEEELIELAKTVILFRNNLKTLKNVLQDNEKALKKWANSNKTAADLDVVSEVAELSAAIKNLFGFEDLDTEWLKENFDLIQQVANGSTEALDKLEQQAAKEYILDLGISDEIYNEYSDILATFVDTDLDVGVNFNDEDALVGLQQFLAEAKLSSDEANAVLNQIGYKGELEEIKEPDTTKTVYDTVEHIEYEPFTQKQVTPYFDGEGYKTATTTLTNYGAVKRTELVPRTVTIPGASY